MADQQPPPAGGKSQGKILGMPRTTGLVVLGVGALVLGYFLLSRLGGSSQSGQSGQSGQGGGQGQGGGGIYGPGHRNTIIVIRDWQGHRGRR